MPDRSDCEDSGNSWCGPSCWIIMEVATLQSIYIIVSVTIVDECLIYHILTYVKTNWFI